MSQERLTDGIDWTKFVGSLDLAGLLREQDPGFLKVARSIVPRGVRELLDRFGWQEIPRGKFPISEGELIVSPDESVLGFQPDNVESGLCGVAVTPGEALRRDSARARIVRPDDIGHHKVYVPEGPYQLVLLAPQPWPDRAADEIVYYTAHAMVACSENPGGRVVEGLLTGFGRDKKPLACGFK